MRPYALIAVAPLLAGCLTVSEQPLGSATLPTGDYHRLALCVNDAAEKEGAETRVIENRAERWTRVTSGVTAFVGGNAPFWDTTFRATGPNTTSVEVKSHMTVRGPDYWPNKVIGDARNCVQTLARR